MIIYYSFDGNHFEYEIEYERCESALYKILSELDKSSLVDFIIESDNCVIDLKDYFYEELKDYFKEYARREYLDRRYS